jgi:competence protein CoiA
LRARAIVEPMFYALDDSGRPVTPTRRARAACPLCRARVVAKCGSIVEWHWAHDRGADCDPWSEGETPWHVWWKQRAPPARREVARGPHRADIVRDDGYVIELQHSAISREMIEEREAFYEKMVWLLDGRTYRRETFLFDMPVQRIEEAGDRRWKWRWPRLAFARAKKRIFIDLGEDILEVRKIEEVSWPKQVFLTGDMIARSNFMSRAALEPVTPHEESVRVSYVAQWRAAVHSRDPNDERTKPQRREFRTIQGLRAWEEDRRPRELEILEWLGDGRLVTSDDRPLGRILDCDRVSDDWKTEFLGEDGEDDV